MNFKNNIKFWTLIALTLLYVTTAVAQAPTQVVSGRVYDAVTHEPLIGAVLTVEGVVPQIGGVTDSYGFSP